MGKDIKQLLLMATLLETMPKEIQPTFTPVKKPRMKPSLLLIEGRPNSRPKRRKKRCMLNRQKKQLSKKKKGY